MKTLVITSCTSRKRDYKAPASEMYTGQQHQRLMEGLKQLRTCYGKSTIDLAIISAKYGLLSENKVIAPYNVTFSGLNTGDLLERSNNLHIYEHVETLIVDYDLVFFLLGKKYVQVLQLPFQVADSVTQIFLLGDTHRKMILELDLPNTHFVPAGESLRHALDTNFTALKGIVFKKLCEAACKQGFEVFEEVKNNPQLILEIVRQNS